MRAAQAVAMLAKDLLELARVREHLGELARCHERRVEAGGKC
jgi:hypothetical protein